MRGERFPPGLLRRREHNIAELQRLVSWLHHQGEAGLARRARALLLYKIHKPGPGEPIAKKELIYVVKESGVGKRQLARWLSWYRQAGLKRLLSPFLDLQRQCCRCGFLGPDPAFRADRDLCLECHRHAMRLYRSTERGAAAARAYLRSPAHRRALRSYFATPKGREARRRAYISSTLRAFRAEAARAAGL